MSTSTLTGSLTPDDISICSHIGDEGGRGGGQRHWETKRRKQRRKGSERRAKGPNVYAVVVYLMSPVYSRSARPARDPRESSPCPDHLLAVCPLLQSHQVLETLLYLPLSRALQPQHHPCGTRTCHSAYRQRSSMHINTSMTLSIVCAHTTHTWCCFAGSESTASPTKRGTTGN
ncbi:unnamed protein product [Pleuronectes platessa]|uniref:Uncharacterized protein n=1 Tax=Pleuronectes platessa TaxID=8262 RepID=A0A9N7TV85_PLEPL|nr:unnamed protein product [Pleuronectes platessa]